MQGDDSHNKLTKFVRTLVFVYSSPYKRSVHYTKVLIQQVRLPFRYRREKPGSSVTLYYSVQLVINGSDLLQLIAQIYYKSSTTVHKCIQMYGSVLHYKYCIPPTCFGHSCGHTRGGALPRMEISRYYKSL